MLKIVRCGLQYCGTDACSQALRPSALQADTRFSGNSIMVRCGVIVFLTGLQERAFYLEKRL
jgi:hypothetical protein